MIRAAAVLATLAVVSVVVIRYGDKIVDWLDRGNDLGEDDEPQQPGLAYIAGIFPPPDPYYDDDAPLNLHELHVWQACVDELERHPH